MNRYRFTGLFSRIVLILFILTVSVVVSAEDPAAPSPTPVSEEQQMLNKRIAFVENQKKLKQEINDLEQQIAAIESGSGMDQTSATRTFRTPKSLWKPTLILVILNFLVLSIVMIVRHKTQEPK